jgi:CRP/FNR family cyclic AMP-dependent transcriptional regulator
LRRTAWALHRRLFDQLRLVHPGIDCYLVEVLAAQVVRLTNQLLEALYVPSERRVLRRLCDLACEYGDGQAGTVIPLTQDDLASMAGTTRPTTNRVLRAAEEAGLVDVGRARIEIRDPQLLARRGALNASRGRPPRWERRCRARGGS